MRFPSLESLADSAARTFLRFPIAIILAAKAVIIGMCWTHLTEYPGGGQTPGRYWDAIVSCYLGMLLSIAMTVWLGRGNARRGKLIATQAAVLALTALYYWSLPPAMTTAETQRTVVLALGLHWLIAVIGFDRDQVNGFWQFNKRLFLRALTAWLYTVVLYAGVALALLAVNHLFNVNIRDRIYQDCWWLIGGLFSVWFFLAGFPRAYDNPEEINDYPKGLKVFTQYVLLTLVTVYLLILYAYMFKIIFTWHWPVGWVAWMVMALAVAGILSLLLIYPLRNDPDNAWVRGYSRFFYAAQLPLIVLLYIAIFKRIMPYGITEQRYFLIALALWLLGVTIYFLVSKRKDIRVLPLSLCITAFLSCWGPWGAFSVSLSSQRHRLERLLDKYGLIVHGRAVAAARPGAIALKDRIAISSVFDYLVDQRGYKTLQPLFSQNLDSLMRANNLTGRWSESGQEQTIMGLVNIPYTSPWATMQDLADTTTVREFLCDANSDSATVTDGAMYLGKFAVGPGDTDWDFVGVGEDKLRITVDSARSQLKLAWVSGGKDLLVDLGPLAETILKTNRQYSFTLEQRLLELPFSGQSIAGKIVIDQIGGERIDQKVQFRRIRGMILFSKR